MLIDQVLILAIIQGLTEFLPISSSGHLVLAPKLLGFSDPGLAVDAFLHIGTLFAVLIYFRIEIFNLIKSFFSDDSPNRKLALAIALATLPAVLVGFGFKSFFESSVVRSAEFIALTLIAGSVLLFFADNFATKKLKNVQTTDLSYLQIFFIGCMQALALFPGMSRSGVTIAAGIFTSLTRDEAARFSFILGLPAIAGAGLLSVKDLLEMQAEAGLDYMSLGLGLLVSFIVGYLAIDFLVKFLRKESLLVFIFYRIALAILIICFSP